MTETEENREEKLQLYNITELQWRSFITHLSGTLNFFFAVLYTGGARCAAVFAINGYIFSWRCCSYRINVCQLLTMKNQFEQYVAEIHVYFFKFMKNLYEFDGFAS